MITNLAQLKKKLIVGTVVTLIRHDWYPQGNLIGKQRKIKTVQTNAVQFEPSESGKEGSWLHWPKAAEVSCIPPDIFQIALTPDFSKLMQYQIYKTEA